MFDLNLENKKLLHQFITENLPKILEDDFEIDDFGWIFKTKSFFENTDFSFITNTLVESKRYIKENQLPIEKLSICYDLHFPLNITSIDIKSLQEADLLYYILDRLDEVGLKEMRLTPPKLIMENQAIRTFTSSKRFDMASSYCSYNLQNIPKSFFKTPIENIETNLVIYSETTEKNWNNTEIWFELVI